MDNMNISDEKKNSGGTDKGIFLTVRQLSFSIAAFLFLSIVVFIGGYFWGQKKIIENISDKMEQEGFSDHVSSSLISLYDTEAPTTSEDQDELQEKVEAEDAGKDLKSTSTLAEKISGEPKKDSEKGVDKKLGSIEEKLTETPMPEKDGNTYHAQLVGGTNKAITQFKSRLNKHGIEVIVKKRKGKTNAGKQIVWHQAVTEEMNSKGELEDLVERIKKLEKLKDVNIITQKKG